MANKKQEWKLEASSLFQRRKTPAHPKEELYEFVNRPGVYGQISPVVYEDPQDAKRSSATVVAGGQSVRFVDQRVSCEKVQSPPYKSPYRPNSQYSSRNSSISNSENIESFEDSIKTRPSDKLGKLPTPVLRDKFIGDLFLQGVDVVAAKKEQPPNFSPEFLEDISPNYEEINSPVLPKDETNDGLHIMSLGSMTCTRCGEGFEAQEKIVNSNGQLWHKQCFVCAQCFRPFPEDIFYEFEGRKYCEHDFQVLFAPCCGKCNEFIIGRVIKAMNANWHPQCFCCQLCGKELADLGFIRNTGRALCHECNARVKAESLGKYMCHKCHAPIDGQPLRWRGDTFHPYHFNCASCGIELNADAREVKSRPGYTVNEMNELYCLRCHDKMGIPICGACRRPIEERVVTALGKHWHVEHFVCAKCEKPFMGHRHYEKKGLAYCETHYHELFGNLCFICNQVIYGDVVLALNKAWCTHHFACALCDIKMTQKTKFFEFDQKPICKKCYERFPQELKKRLKRQHEVQARGGKPLP
ncbi:LIM zinc finger domain containing stck isoform X2 [Oratosquilla oratoria]|uniref:LIM zinc finger domain containing stck isoform X2 n=1 Tax=Oratosquilla oratoria TaxID=337810 RepID=UPI003F75E119